MKKRMVIGISGASGALIAIGLLQAMKMFSDWETYLIMTPSAELTISQETPFTPAQVSAMASVNCDNNDLAAPISSGSFRTEGMVVVPCSMKTLAGIAAGYSDNLLLRAADVTIKERRKLVLVARETPLSSIHIRNMLTLSETGAVMLPPMVSYYNKPESIDDITRSIVGRILDQFRLEYDLFTRWKDER